MSTGLDRCNSDWILLTAREVPLVGGLILARAGSADEVWEMIREDPFSGVPGTTVSVSPWWTTVRASPARSS